MNLNTDFFYSRMTTGSQIFHSLARIIVFSSKTYHAENTEKRGLQLTGSGSLVEKTFNLL